MKTMFSHRLALIAAGLVLGLAQSSLAGPQWQGANWVWDSAEMDQGPLGREPRLLRRVVELKGMGKIVSAVALVDVDDNHRLFVNGQLVGGKVGWQEPGRYDLLKF